MSVLAAASLITFTDWASFTSAQLAKKLGDLNVAPKPGKLRRQAQLNVWETTSARLSPLQTAGDLCWYATGLLSSTAEDRLVELFKMRAAELRAVAVKQGLVSAATAETTRLHQLVKLIFVYEFTIMRAVKNTACVDVFSRLTT